MNLKNVIALTGLSLVMALPKLATAQTVQVGTGTPCSYTSYTQTVSGGQSSFVFQTSGCNSSGGGSSPGTLAFSSANNNGSIDVNGSRTFAVTRSGGTSGAVQASLSVTPGGTCSSTTTQLNWADGTGGDQSFSVTAGVTPGSCSISFTSGNGNGNTTVQVVNPSAVGTLAFGTVAGSTSITTTVGNAFTIPVVLTGHGSTAPAASLTGVTCTMGTTGSTATTTFPISLTAAAPSTNLTFTAPTAPGTVSCTSLAVTGASPGGSNQSFTVTVNNPAAPVCQTATATPASLASGTSQIAVTCTGTGITFGSWAATGANSGSAPSVGATTSTSTTASATVTLAASPTAGTYQYTISAQNAGGTVNPTVSVTVQPPASANCVVKDKVADYPIWTGGNAYNTTFAPQIVQAPNETIAFKFPAATANAATNHGLLDSAKWTPTGGGNASGGIQIYEAGVRYVTYSITTSPCEFTDTPGLATCQMSSNAGSFGKRYASPSHTAPDSTLAANDYCRLPALPSGQDFYYLNVRFAGPSSIVTPPTSTCTETACAYYPLFYRN